MDGINITDKELIKELAEKAHKQIKQSSFFTLQSKRPLEKNPILSFAYTILKVQIEKGLGFTDRSLLQQYLSSEQVVVDLNTTFGFVRRGIGIISKEPKLNWADFSEPAYLFLFQCEFSKQTANNNNHADVVDQLVRSYLLYALFHIAQFEVFYFKTEYKNDQARTNAQLEAQSFLINAQSSVGLAMQTAGGAIDYEDIALAFADHVLKEHGPAIKAGIGKKLKNEETSVKAKAKWLPLILEVQKKLDNYENPLRQINRACKKIAEQHRGVNPGTLRNRYNDFLKNPSKYK